MRTTEDVLLAGGLPLSLGNTLRAVRAAKQRGVDDVGFLRAVVARLDGDPVWVEEGAVMATTFTEKSSFE